MRFTIPEKIVINRFGNGVGLFAVLLLPVALNLFQKQNALTVCVCALVETDVGKDVGLIPVGGFVYVGPVCCKSFARPAIPLMHHLCWASSLSDRAYSCHWHRFAQS